MQHFFQRAENEAAAKYNNNEITANSTVYSCDPGDIKNPYYTATLFNRGSNKVLLYTPNTQELIEVNPNGELIIPENSFIITIPEFTWRLFDRDNDNNLQLAVLKQRFATVNKNRPLATAAEYSWKLEEYLQQSLQEITSIENSDSKRENSASYIAQVLEAKVGRKKFQAILNTNVQDILQKGLPYNEIADAQTPREFHTINHYLRSYLKLLNIDPKTTTMNAILNKIIDSDKIPAPTFHIHWEQPKCLRYARKFVESIEANEKQTKQNLKRATAMQALRPDDFEDVIKQLNRAGYKPESITKARAELSELLVQREYQFLQKRDKLRTSAGIKTFFATISIIPMLAFKIKNKTSHAIQDYFAKIYKESAQEAGVYKPLLTSMEITADSIENAQQKLEKIKELRHELLQTNKKSVVTKAKSSSASGLSTPAMERVSLSGSSSNMRPESEFINPEELNKMLSSLEKMPGVNSQLPVTGLGQLAPLDVATPESSSIKLFLTSDQKKRMQAIAKHQEAPNEYTRKKLNAEFKRSKEKTEKILEENNHIGLHQQRL